MVERGPKKENSHIKRQQKIVRLKNPTKKGEKAENADKGTIR